MFAFKKSEKLLLSGLALTSLLVLSGCNLKFSYVDGFSFNYTGETAEKNEQDSIGDGITSVDIENRFGDVKIEAVDGEFGWSWDLKVWSESEEDAKAFLELIEMEVAEKNGKQTWRLVLPEEDSQLLKGVKSNLTLRVPKGVATGLANRHGNSEVMGVAGDVNLKSGHGDLHLKKITGNAKVEVSHGNLTGEVFSTLHATARHGNVDVSGIGSECTIDTQHGNVVLNDVEGRLEIEASHGNVDVAGLKQSAVISASHGNIKLTLPEGASPKLDARVSHGNMKSDFESNDSGSQVLQLEAQHGNISVKKS